MNMKDMADTERQILHVIIHVWKLDKFYSHMESRTVVTEAGKGKERGRLTHTKFQLGGISSSVLWSSRVTIYTSQ